MEGEEKHYLLLRTNHWWKIHTVSFYYWRRRLSQDSAWTAGADSFDAYNVVLNRRKHSPDKTLVSMLATLLSLLAVLDWHITKEFFCRCVQSFNLAFWRKLRPFCIWPSFAMSCKCSLINSSLVGDKGTHWCLAEPFIWTEKQFVSKSEVETRREKQKAV